MRLVTFSENGLRRIGVWLADGGRVVDLAARSPEVPTDMIALIQAGLEGLEAVRKAVERSKRCLPLEKVILHAPIPVPPRNIFCIGKNYREHVKEIRAALEERGAEAGEDDTAVPVVFTKATTAVIGPGAPIPASLDETDSVDYEGELAVVIGMAGRGISRERAMDHVYGYTIINDVTSRRMQKRHRQWFMGKSLDGFCPMGPALVTRDDIADASCLRLQTHVNDELRQDAVLTDMIFDIPSLIAALSRGMTLLAGDIIATGTPAGVGMGFKPPRFLRHGDRVSITVDPIGTLTNPVA